MANTMYMLPVKEGKTIDGAFQMATNYFIGEGMETQRFQNGSCHILQARARSGELKMLVGMDKAVEIRMTMNNENTMVTIEMGGAKWADKAAVMAVSAFILWPLAITSGIGIYGQKKTLDRVKQIIDWYFYC